MINESWYTSNTDQWTTPQDLFDELDAEFGFTLDVCASQSNTKCRRFFNEETNGLAQDWTKDVCWMNPPYGRTIGEWVKKAAESARGGAVVVALVPARTDTAWFQDYVIGEASEVRFIRGRLKFGDSKNAAPFPSAVVVYDGRPKRWKTL